MKEASKYKGSLKEIFQVFFKLGVIGFGGPAAHISMMEEEVVSKRKWLSREHFLDLMGATNLIPGPNSTEMTMHCGYERGGWAGLFIAGSAFIFPAVVLSGILAYFYAEYGELPEAQPFLLGIKPAVLAIIASAIFKLGKKAAKSTELILLGIITVAASFLGVNEILALLGTGLLGILYFTTKSNMSSAKSISPLGILLPFLVLPKMSTAGVFWTFLKVGAVLYGSGYVLFAYLDAELVSKGWMTRQVLIDSVAAGQFTPGPVLSTATFIGYQLDGFQGAILATLGIFLPSFLFVLLLNPLVSRMRKSKFLGYFLDSVNIAAVAIMIVVLFRMGQESLMDWKTWLIAGLSFIVVFKFKKTNPVFIVLGGALLAFLLYKFC